MVSRGEILPKPSWENGEKNLILIENRDWGLWIKDLSTISNKGMLSKPST